ncbi:Transcription initiation factor TFIID subunit [Klebsormidium nitens]|uniref:Transcription initiation factor TFIID subunit n=1 Tax=Klebsormidium nitens TaxID=105231 RepID=A0A1Y1HNQ6_KLENI|nr:Transcription initiation factor TFIID subunit [Klebsormidium nitens]|eukprot:GAQ78809.1 Transcription initiation factor TFIID subunit [Klebsormidium nitens]
MSLVSKNSIQVAAQSLGIPNLGDEVAQALAPDVEYRIREICQEAIKCMRHSKRSTLTTDDVNSALSLRNVEPLYGFSSDDPLRFRKALGHSDLFYLDDKELDFSEIIDAPLPKPPIDTTVIAHWLAVDGVQPAIQENPPPGAELTLPTEQKKKIEGQPGLGAPEDLPVEVKPAVKHVISKELQLYFEKIMELVTSGTDSKLLNDAVRSLASDSGIHPLVPYFIQFIQDEVQRSLHDLPLLFTLMRVAEALLANPHVHIEGYLQQLIPSVVTCLVARRLGGRKNGYRHWDLRDFSATIVATICHRYGHSYSNIQPRLTKTLVNSFLNPKQTYPQHYGSIKGLVALGNRVVRLLVLPNLATYLELLREDLDPQKQKDEVRRYEAQRVYGLLQVAAGNCMFEALKEQPQLGELLLKSRPMTGAKVRTSKAGKDTKPEGPSAMDTSAPEARQTRQGGLPGSSGQTEANAGTNGSVVGKKRRRPPGETQEDASKVLAEAWKEEGDTWRLFGKLIELFGDSMLPFVPRPQLTLMHSYN